MTTALPRFESPGGPLPPSSSAEDVPGFGGLSCELGQLPLRALHIETHIVGLDAVVHLRQRFANPTGHVVETTYVFPLPARAAVTEFAATLGGHRIVGLLRERQVAREIYDDAVAAGHRAGIVEEERPEVFTARVGNLGPNEEATVELVLVHRLAVSDGEATFRFPLVVAPRYVPGDPIDGYPVGDGTALDTDAVPDASRVTPPVLVPGCPSLVALSLSVTVDPAGLRLSDARCSLHALAEGAPPAGAAITGPVRVDLVPGEPLDRDFILRLRLGAGDLDTAAVLVPDTAPASGAVAVGGGGHTALHGKPVLEGDGTFFVTLLPPAAGAVSPEPTDVIVVLDRSGSMAGWKMVAARRAAARILDALGPADRIGVLAFDNRVESFNPAGDRGRAAATLQAATDATRFAAVEWLARIEARGGTELGNALVVALGMATAPERDTVVVLVTDGQVADEDRLAALAQQAGANVRLHCVGIDQAVNGGLLERLSRLGHGHCELVESEERLDEVLVALHRRIRPPELTGVTIAGDGLEILPGTLTPSGVLDVFPGAPLEISGRYRGSGSLIVRATGHGGGAVEHHLAPLTCNEGSLGAIWGRSRIRDLEDLYAAHGDESVAAALVATSLATGVLSRHTAFIAVDESERLVHSGEMARLVQPVAMPAGWAPVARRLTAGSRRRPSMAAMAPGEFMASAMAPRASLPTSPGDDLRKAVAAARQAGEGTLDPLTTLRAAIALAKVLLAGLRAGEIESRLEEALRALVVALLEMDQERIEKAADAAVLALRPGGQPGREAPFWKRP